MKKVRIIAAALGVAVSLCCLCVPAFADGESWETVDTGTRPHTEAVETKKPAEPAVPSTPEPAPENTPTPEPTVTTQPESTPKAADAPAASTPAVTVPITTTKPKAETPVTAKPEPVQTAIPVSTASEEIAANDSVAKPADDTEKAADTEEKADNPFTPAGTSSVVDNADDTDGKEFFTITTADGNVFYLVIDRQRGTENVYFLNTVTESDLMALAEIPEGTVTQQVPTVQPEPVPTAEPEAEPEPEPEAPARKGVGALPVILAVALIGGGAGWYFKVYRPKQAQAAAADDYDASEYAEYMGEDDTPPWDEDEEADGE